MIGFNPNSKEADVFFGNHFKEWATLGPTGKPIIYMSPCGNEWSNQPYTRKEIRSYKKRNWKEQINQFVKS